MNFRNFLFALLIALLCSCSSKKNIIYFQDLKSSEEFKVNYQEQIIRVDDILKIDVSTADPEISTNFNNRGTYNALTSDRESMILMGYQVDNFGFISYPRLGKVKVSGLTKYELSEKLIKLLVESGELVNPHIDVKFLNLNFTVLGEVNKPGNYSFIENNLNILEALGIAGDLTINGERKDIKLIRQSDNNKKVYSIDLTKKNLLKEDYFQIISGDVIIVNPNTTRVKNAGVIGNSGTLISLLSFILSTIIVTTR